MLSRINYKIKLIIKIIKFFYEKKTSVAYFKNKTKYTIYVY